MLKRIGSLILLAAVIGCGGSQPTGDVVSTVPASGVLTLNGTPLEYYQVAFFPVDNRPAIGVTDAEGRFVLGTNQPEDGAVPGQHRVAVTWVGPPSDNPAEGMTEFTPPPPPKHKTDGKYGNPETSGLTVQVPEAGSSELAIDLK